MAKRKSAKRPRQPVTTAIEPPKGQATTLISSLNFRILCDSASVKQLSPRQKAAMHAFVLEVLASFSRMTMEVPTNEALKILNKRFAQAKKIQPPKRQYP